MFNPFKKTILTRAIFFIVIDILLIIAAFLLAFLFRFEWQIPPQYFPLIVRVIVLAVIFIVPIFYFQKLYSFSWSYVSINEVVSLFKATTISFLFLSITLYISKYFPYFNDFPRSVIFISYFLVFILCGGLRFAKKIYLHIFGFPNPSEKEKTLIVGAGNAAEQILRNMLSSKNSPYLPVGFVDDSTTMQGITIHGFKVLGRISDIPTIVKIKQVKQLVIAIPSASNNIIKKAVELGRQSGLWKIKIAPPLNEIMRGQVHLKNLRNVDAEDLLGRESIDLNTKEIENFIKGKIVLITGAAGSIGSELSRQVAKFKPLSLIMVDQDETGIFNIAKEIRSNFPNVTIQPLVGDIGDQEVVQKIFGEEKPKIVFHAAAYKHVPLMEMQPDQAVKNNILGTQVLVECSLDVQVHTFIFISTDKAVNPTSVMGSTKRIGEMICQVYNQKNITKFISVRFGNVLDSRGSVIPIFREQIKKGGPVEVTDPEMKRYFMLNSEACLLVMQAGAMGQGGEVFVLDMGKPIKIYDLAKDMIKLSGFKPDQDIAIVFTGVRPGEKLFEEILTAEEGIIATKNQKIFIAKMKDINFDTLWEKIDKLKNIIKKGSNSEEIKIFLKGITS